MLPQIISPLLELAVDSDLPLWPEKIHGLREKSPALKISSSPLVISSRVLTLLCDVKMSSDLIEELWSLVQEVVQTYSQELLATVPNNPYRGSGSGNR